MPFFQGVYSDVVLGATGQPVAGAAVALYPVASFAVGVLPVAAPGFGASYGPVVCDATGSFSVRNVAPDDYHVLVQYTPPGGVLVTTWRYNVAVGPYGGVVRASKRGFGFAAPRTLAKLMSGSGATILCVGDGVTVGYNATGTVSGGWVARLAARIAASLPAQQVVRYDPTSYGTTLDAPIPSWSAVGVQAGTGQGPVAVINAGVTGDAVLRVLRRFSNLSAASWSPPPDCYVVSLGLVESNPASPSTAAAAAVDFGAHLAALVNELRLSGAEVVLLTPHQNTQVAAFDDYVNQVRAVAALAGVGLVDVRQLWLDHYDVSAANDGQGAWLSTGGGDHISPTDAGHVAIGDEIYKAFDVVGELPVPGLLGAGAGRTPEVVRLLNASPLLTFSGGWVTAGAFQLSTLLASAAEKQHGTPGATITFKARFSELSMLCRRWHDGGQISVTVDGGLATPVVEMYRAGPASTSDLADFNGAIAPQDRVLLAYGLSDVVHTVTLTLLATKNPSSLGTMWRFDALELVRLRVVGLAIEAADPLTRVERGVALVSLAGANSGGAVVTFAVPFSAPPIVVASNAAGDARFFATTSTPITTGCTVSLISRDGSVQTVSNLPVHWIAVGQ